MRRRETALEQAVEREAGCLSLCTTIKPELDVLRTHPVHGAMVGRLHLYSQLPGPAPQASARVQ